MLVVCAMPSSRNLFLVLSSEFLFSVALWDGREDLWKSISAESHFYFTATWYSHRGLWGKFVIIRNLRKNFQRKFLSWENLMFLRINLWTFTKFTHKPQPTGAILHCLSSTYSSSFMFASINFALRLFLSYLEDGKRAWYHTSELWKYPLNLKFWIAFTQLRFKSCYAFRADFHFHRR